MKDASARFLIGLIAFNTKSKVHLTVVRLYTKAIHTTYKYSTSDAQK